MRPLKKRLWGVGCPRPLGGTVGIPGHPVPLWQGGPRGGAPAGAPCVPQDLMGAICPRQAGAHAEGHGVCGRGVAVRGDPFGGTGVPGPP